MAEPGFLRMEWGNKRTMVAFVELVVVVAIAPLLAVLGLSKAFQQSFFHRGLTGQTLPASNPHRRRIPKGGKK
jgi:hypothetical protein